MREVTSISDLDEITELTNEVNRLEDENYDLKALVATLESQTEELTRAYQELHDEISHVAALIDRMVK